MDSPEMNLKGEFVDDVHRQWVFTYYDRYVSAQAEVFSKARDYTNIIIVAGYAAFFGIWAGMASDLPQRVRLIAGGLMAISLVLFVTWELITMHGRVAAGRRLGNVLREAAYPDDFEEKWNAALAENHREDLKVARYWAWIFYPTCFTGLLGGCAIAVAAFVELARLGVS